ncbi:hypothetical protein BHE74_00050038 [Ensete ventricosum]|nr:hypothetical protein BHE74_00050038 [Ensete ventricosum]
MPAPYRVLLFFTGTCYCHRWLRFTVIFQPYPSMVVPTALNPPLQPTHAHRSVRSNKRIAATVVALTIPYRCILCSPVFRGNLPAAILSPPLLLLPASQLRRRRPH